MLQMSVFDMKFGESILLKRNTDALLVDCGSKSNRKAMIDVISDKIGSPAKLAFMLTHFHDDHFKYFKQIAKKKGQADILYLPWLSFRKKTYVALFDVALCLYFLYTKKDLNVSFLLFDQKKYIVQWVKPGGWVQALEQGDKFDLNDTTMEVLWPASVPLEDIYDNDCKKVRKILRDIIKELFSSRKECKEFCSLRKKLQEIHKKFRNLFSGDRHEFQLDDKTISMLEQLSDQEKRILQELDQKYGVPLRKDRKKTEDWRNKLRDIFHDDINATSIVFRDYQEKETNRYHLLMTGDVTIPVVDKYLFDAYFKRKWYQYMKCPHHGTDTNYTICLPYSDNLIISNGGNQHHNISSDYFYHADMRGERYCTNARCDIIKNKNRCCSENGARNHCGTDADCPYFDIDI
ncbi:hypothetical protein [Megasphaera elsdenii]|uniref:hypothetical protein n=1 Tax=Megasphaera elsdenii TaxID=907 RepID=UPI00242B519F|nr:hypothetical protein [Megasphaera elsdenii]